MEGEEKRLFQIQWSQKIRNSHLYSSVSQAGSQMVGSTLQTPLPSPHHTSSLQVTCVLSLITEQNGDKESGQPLERAWPWYLTGAGCLARRLPACWLSVFFFLLGHLFLTCLTAAAWFPSGHLAKNMGSGI